MLSLRNLLNKEFVIVAILIILIMALFSYNGSKYSMLDGLTNAGSDEIPAYGDSYESVTGSSPAEYTESGGHDFLSGGTDMTGFSNSSTIDGMQTISPSMPVNDPNSLLPTDHNSDWARLNPSMSAGATPDLLQAGYHIGLNTIGQTLKNANLQIRSEPIIQKQDVGPWMQSTIEPDLGRVPLEIGSPGY